MRKRDWRDSWVIGVLCTVETMFYPAQWAGDVQRWIAMTTAFLVTLIAFAVYKRIQSSRLRKSSRL